MKDVRPQVRHEDYLRYRDRIVLLCIINALQGVIMRDTYLVSFDLAKSFIYGTLMSM